MTGDKQSQPTALCVESLQSPWNEEGIQNWKIVLGFPELQVNSFSSNQDE